MGAANRAATRAASTGIRATARGENPFGVGGQPNAGNLQTRAQRMYEAHTNALPSSDGPRLMWDQVPQQTKDAWIKAAEVDHDAAPVGQAALSQAAGNYPASATTPGLAGHAGQGAPGKNLDLNADYLPGGPKEGEAKPGTETKKSSK